MYMPINNISYGSIEIEVEFSNNSTINQIQEYLRKNNLAEKVTNNLHITLLYGLLPSITKEDVIANLNRCKFYLEKYVSCNQFEVFETDISDVLVLKVNSECVDNLRQWNDRLKLLPYKNDYPDYKPHITLAYLTKGAGKEIAHYLNSNFINNDITTFYQGLMCELDLSKMYYYSADDIKHKIFS